MESEAKILADLIKKSETETSGILTPPLFKLFIWIAVVMFLLCVNHYLENSRAISMTCMFVGGMIGMPSTFQTGEKMWPISRPHINLNSARERLHNISAL